MSPLDVFKREVVTYLRGLLALFDIADAKRRNFHLSHQVVDREIDELDRQIRTSVGASGLAMRVGGLCNCGAGFSQGATMNRRAA